MGPSARYMNPSQHLQSLSMWVRYLYGVACWYIHRNLEIKEILAGAICGTLSKAWMEKISSLWKDGWEERGREKIDCGDSIDGFRNASIPSQLSTSTPSFNRSNRKKNIYLQTPGHRLSWTKIRRANLTRYQDSLSIHRWDIQDIFYVLRSSPRKFSLSS